MTQIGDNNYVQKFERSFITKYIYQSDFRWYTIGIIVRIVTTLIYPQTGYIHPDEFFQGPEVVFDDIFKKNLTRTYEFHLPSPLRSVAILYLLYGLPVSILSYLSTIFQWSSIPFHLKLIVPRLSILILSLCTDLLFYRLIKIFYTNLSSKQTGIILNYYGVSYITLIYFTRTLSNTFESFLFLALIYFIHQNLSTVSSLIKNENNSKSTRRYLILTSSLIGLICSLGIFNRPTFPAFALVPILYWLLNIIPLIGHSSQLNVLLSQILSFIIGTFLVVSSLLILFDSYYYNNGLMFLFDIKNHLIICPLNFILYNIDSTNLDKHGLHPPWLHIIVNGSILYGPLHLCVILWALSNVFNIKQFGQKIFNQILNLFLQRRTNEEQSISSLLIYLYLIPYFPLSIFPHQEARFLLPLLFPLILFIIPRLINKNIHKSIFRFWLIFNIILALLYGYLHQGGLLPALRYIHNIQSNINKKIVVTYHTYMPPGYLVTPMSKFEYEQTELIDLKGAKREELDMTIENIFNQYSKDSIQVFVVLPGSCRNDLIYLQEQKYSVNLLKQVQLHLDFDHNFEEPFHVKYAGTIFQWISTIWNKYKLNIYEVTRG